ncbi:CTP-dependent riboflavin kinase [Candidatus Bathyarchaeota archaeon]|nr:CTP-dependent riboflavin kinase [Candidatus Bathyarchaeota archaeon]
MKTWLLMTLYRLAEITLASNGSHTTASIAGELGLSQQTASRHLIELENQGMIKRERLTRGTSIKITDKGTSELRKMYHTLHRILEKPRRQLTLEGELFTGLGEGAYYVSQTGFLRKFQERLDFKPFIGTLNVRLKGQQLKNRSLMESLDCIEIEGFRNWTRSFGPVKCYPATVNEEVQACVIRPLRTHYGEDVIEILAPINLRRKLNLKDGDKVRISFVT